MYIEKWRPVRAMTDDEKVLFSQNIKSLRDSSGLTEEEFADFLGVSESTVRTWINGTAMPQTMGKLDEVASLFGLTGRQLVSAGYRLRQDAIHGYVVSIEEVYPYNLLLDAYRKHDEDRLGCDYMNIPPNRVFEILRKFEPRTQAMLEQYYRDGLSYREIAPHFGVQYERVRQVISQALYHLNHEIYQENKNIEHREHRLEQKLQEAYSEIRELKALLDEKDDAPCNTEHDIENLYIGQLGLSVRTYNILRRSGINTLADIVTFDRGPKKWNTLHNMGTKAEVDLCLAVKEAGYGMDMSKFSKGAVFEIEEMQQKRARQDTIRNK